MAFEGFTNEGATVSIGTSAIIDTTDEASAITDFEADTYTEVGTIETKPEIGVSSNVVTANPLVGDEIARKGSRTFPESTMELLFEPGSDGIGELKDAEQSRDPFSFKIEYGDAPDDTGTGTIHYFQALVTGVTYPSGGVDEFARVTIGLKMTTRVYESAAAAGGS